jgi:hypothetical protein
MIHARVCAVSEEGRKVEVWKCRNVEEGDEEGGREE